MVGVGVFGVPYAFAQSGFWIGFGFLIAIGLFTLISDLMYGEVILRTQADHQMVGYTSFYLGPVFKKILFFSIALTFYAAILAYIIVAGDFLNNIFSSFFYISQTTYSLIFFVIGSFMLLRGIKKFFWAEFLMTILFVVIIVLIFGFGLFKINWGNLNGVDYDYWFLPYGVLLFAFAGWSAIPIQRQILAGQEKFLKKSIFVPVVIVAGLYLLFALTVVGVSGEATTSDALSGLFQFLGPKIIILGSVFGFLAVSSSFFMLGTAFMEIFNLDYQIPRKPAWLLTIVPPFILFIGGLREFIDVISLAGSVAIALEGTILVFLYIKSKSKGDRIPEYSLDIPKWILYLIISLFLGGIAYTLFLG